MEPIVWKVFKECKFVGYIVSYRMIAAQLQTSKKYGSNCLIESYKKEIKYVRHQPRKI